MSDFALSSYSYGMDGPRPAIQKLVDGYTPEDLTGYAEQVAQSRSEYQQKVEQVNAAIDNPQTLEDYQLLVRNKGVDALTPEQKREIDRLQAEKAEPEVEEKPLEFVLHETKHTKKGHDLFVVQTSERVDRSTFEQLRSKAQDMGGRYSGYAKQGAIPGYTFTDKATAEAFIAGESLDDAGSEEHEKQDRGLSRLSEVADRTKAQGEKTLNQDRLINTERRAQQADGIESNAQRKIALADTAERIAQAGKEGKLKHLKKFSALSHVEMLEAMLSRARHARHQDTNSYKKNDPVQIEDIDHAMYPSIEVSVSILNDLANTVENAPKGKLTANQLRARIKRTEGDSYRFSTKKESTDRKLLERILTKLKITGENYIGWQIRTPMEEIKRLERLGIRTAPQLREALREYFSYRSEAPQADPIKQAERDLVGRKIEGYFPTPAPVVERMLEEADIEPGMKILEPSAGKGNIADALKEAGAEVDTIEPVGDLRTILEAKGHTVTGYDLMEHGVLPEKQRAEMAGLVKKIEQSGKKLDKLHQAQQKRTHDGAMSRARTTTYNADTSNKAQHLKDTQGHLGALIREAQRNGSVVPESFVGAADISADFNEDGKYDPIKAIGYHRIVMNPPFEKGQDIEHVRHAHSLLKPGGRVVAIMSEGPFFRKDKKAIAFREWLEDLGGTSEQLPEGSFKESNTGVNTRLVVIDKPETVSEQTSNKETDYQPRYAAYLKTTDSPNNADYIAFIMGKSGDYNESIGLPRDLNIRDHDAFTAFIETQVEQSTHVEPDGTIEPATDTVIIEAAKDMVNSGNARDRKHARDLLIEAVDKRIALANAEGRKGRKLDKDEERTSGGQILKTPDSFVTFDIPGDGIFKVGDTVTHLERFKSRIKKLFTPKGASKPRQKSPTIAASIKDFVIQGEDANAYELARLAGKEVVFGVFPHSSHVSDRGQVHLFADPKPSANKEDGPEVLVARGESVFRHNQPPQPVYFRIDTNTGAIIAQGNSRKSVAAMARGKVKVKLNQEELEQQFIEQYEIETEGQTLDEAAQEAATSTKNDLPEPTLKISGKPYPSKKSAILAIRGRNDYSPDTHEPVEVDGGWGISLKAVESPTDQSAPMYSRSEAESNARPLEKALLSRLIKRLLIKPSHTLDVIPTLVNTFADLPVEIQEDAKANNAENGINGVVHNGKVYIVADKMTSEEMVAETLFHELYGHYGSRLFFNQQGMKGSMLKLWSALGGYKGVLEIADKYGINLEEDVRARFEDRSLSVEERNAYIMDELLAQLMGKLTKKEHRITKAVKEIVGRIKEWMRSFGSGKLNEWVNEKLGDKTDAEVIYLLKQIRENLGQSGDSTGKDDLNRPSFQRNESPEATINHARSSQDLYRGIAEAAKQKFRERPTASQIKEQVRKHGLGWLNGLQLEESYSHVFNSEGANPLSELTRLVRQMKADKNKTMQDADRLQKRWAALKGKANGKPMNEELGEIMLDATHLGLYPDRPFKVQPKVVNLRKEIGKAEGDQKGPLQKELAELMKQSSQLRSRYTNLSKEAQGVYGEIEAQYQDHWEQVFKAIEARLMSSIHDQKLRKAKIDALRLAFEQQMEGPYFPLKRFGDYLMVATREVDGEKERTVEAFEQIWKRDNRKEELEADGWKVFAPTAKEHFGADAPPPEGFMADVFAELDEHGIEDAELRDSLHQLYLRMLPEANTRKSGIHRQNVPGFNRDARRAFAMSMTQGAHHLSKLRYAHQMDSEIHRMGDMLESREWVLNMGDKGSQTEEGRYPTEIEAQQAKSKLEEAIRRSGGDPVLSIRKESNPDVVDGESLNVGRQVLNEMQKRHELLMNPTGNGVTAFLGGLNFAMYLGFSPAAALVNLSQTPMVALPMLGAQYGWKKASSTLGHFSKAYLGKRTTTFDDLDEETVKRIQSHVGENKISLLNTEGLTRNQRLALLQWLDEGTADLTQSHDLSMTAQSPTATGDRIGDRWKRFVDTSAFFFHNVEVMNREATGLAAYELEYQKQIKAGKPEDEAHTAGVRAGRNTIDKAHFDYSGENRARLMQGNVARVLTAFKQYPQNMIYRLVRDFHQSFDGTTEERKLAQRELGGILGMHAIFAGAMGLPYMTLPVALDAVTLGMSGFRDDDEPWDAETEMKLWMAENFGTETAEMVMHGALRGLPIIGSADISSRIQLNELLLREDTRSLEGRSAALKWLETVAGPSFGIFAGGFEASDLFGEGEWERGFEKVVPKAMRDVMKAVRYGKEDLRNVKGVKQLDTDAGDIIAQGLGFNPSRVQQMYEARGDVNKYKDAIEGTRSNLKQKWSEAMATKNGEATHWLQEIVRYNRNHPDRTISGKERMKALKAHRRGQEQMVDGVKLPGTQDYLRGVGAYADL
ncbi:MAG: PLxRFG domain-containing protein [Gammaproteobacteria bacterium]|nr:PLxRFG domain-containing protein [Gammaproteobacteria bacterium]